MEMKVKKIRLKDVCQYVFLIIVYFVMKSFLRSDDTVGKLFLNIMAIVLACACIFGIHITRRLIESMKVVKSWILEVAENTNVSIWDKMNEENTPFKNKILDGIFLSYKKEMNRLNVKEDVRVKCDIGDYINYETLQGYANYRMMAQIPGVMTGLGICGTFVGLVIGLSDFDSSTAEAMSSSIPALIEGIKIAFYTSIYGVIFSLIFNFMLNLILNELDRTIESFVAVFYEKVVPQPINDFTNSIVKYQQEQVDVMKQFAEEIAVKMAKSFNELSAPTFEKISSTIDNMSEKMVSRQSEGMGEVVDSFIQSMNKSLDGEFDNLSKTIHSICEWQKDMMGDMQSVIDEVNKSAENITSINIATENILNNLNLYTQSLSDYQISVNEAYMVIDDQKNSFNEMAKLQLDCIVRMGEHEAGFENSLKSIGENFQQFVIITQKLIDVNNKSVEGMSACIRQDAMSLTKASEVFSSNTQEDINKTFAIFDDNLSSISMHLSGTVEEINATTENLPKTLNMYLDELKTVYQQYIESVTYMQNSMRVTMEQMINANRMG